MRARRVLVLAGGTVALLSAANVRRSRARRAVARGLLAPQPPRLRAVAPLLLFDWGFPNADIDLSWVFFGLGSLIASAFGWVYDFVFAAVKGAINALASFTREAIRLGGQIVDNLVYNVNAAAQSIVGLTEGAWEMAKTVAVLVPETFRAALDGVETIIWKLLKEWLPDVLREVGATIKDLVRDVLGGLWDALEWLGSVYGLLQEGWEILYQLLTNPIETVWGWIWDKVTSIAGELVGIGLDLLWPGIRALFDAIFQYADWLVGFITDPKGTIEDITDQMETKLLTFIRTGIEDAVSQDFPALDKYLTDVLGLA